MGWRLSADKRKGGTDLPNRTLVNFTTVFRVIMTAGVLLMGKSRSTVKFNVIKRLSGSRLKDRFTKSYKERVFLSGGSCGCEIFPVSGCRIYAGSRDIYIGWMCYHSSWWYTSGRPLGRMHSSCCRLEWIYAGEVWGVPLA